jgi:hypothetical protein
MGYRLVDGVDPCNIPGDFRKPEAEIAEFFYAHGSKIKNNRKDSKTQEKVINDQFFVY